MHWWLSLLVSTHCSGYPLISATPFMGPMCFQLYLYLYKNLFLFVFVSQWSTHFQAGAKSCRRLNWPAEETKLTRGNRTKLAGERKLARRVNISPSITTSRKRVAGSEWLMAPNWFTPFEWVQSLLESLWEAVFGSDSPHCEALYLGGGWVGIFGDGRWVSVHCLVKRRRRRKGRTRGTER